MRPPSLKILHKPFVHIILIVVAGLIAYSNTFNVPFQFDDKANIVENPIIKDIRYFVHPSEAKGFTGFGEDPRLKQRYIGHLSFALNYIVHGLDVRGYHAVNLFIHILNSALLYFLVLLTFRTPFMESSLLKERSGLIALTSSLLFVLHPAQTQAVTYIVQRQASLATLFYMSSLVCYIVWRLRTTVWSSEQGVWRKHVFHILSLVSAVLAMNTKQIAFTLPLAISLYEFSFFKGAIRKRVLFLVPLLLTMLIIPLSLINVDTPLGELVGDMQEATTIKNIPRLDYLLTEFRVLVTYLRLLVLPINQNLDYDYPVYDSVFALPVLLSFLLLFSIFSFGIILFKRSRVKDPSSRLIAFGIFWFFIALSVESTIIPLQVIYEHRIYLPSVGAFVVIVTAVFLLLEKAKNQKLKKMASVAFVLILLVLISATYSRNEVWQNRASLWEDVVSKSPENARAHNNLGNAYLLQGMLDKAVIHYLLALKAKPATKPSPRYYAAIHYNLANAYKDSDILDKAIEHYRRSLSIDFGNLGTYNNLGLVYFSKGLTDKAITYFQSAIELDPDYAEAHFNLGEAYFSLGWLDKSIEHYEAFLKLRPNYKEAHYNLGLIHFKKGDMDAARKEFQAVLRIDPGYSEARRYLERTGNY